MEQEDFYQILGVTESTSGDEIRNAYRRLAFQYHPDRNKENAAAAERMKAINEAYAILSDPQKKKTYDSMKKAYGSNAYGQFRQTYSQQDIFRGSDIDQVLEEMGKLFGFRGFDDIFKEFYGSGYQHFKFQRAGGTAKGFVFRFSPGGKADPRQMPRSPHTLGKLLKYGMEKMWGVELPEKGKDLSDRITISAERAVTGGKILYVNRRNGKELRVTLPRGVRQGQKIRLKGMGENGKGGADAGDLYLSVRIRKPLAQKVRDFFSRQDLPKRKQ
ncbi:MAG: J domain-containing protein [Deltaproteobacteria bacterium]|nr:J domain-containing protein [Deltaproteobacteria bacterium]MBW1815899.1 J domain-containing protein [Deltaproteobacteria bacterium]MBW2283092.1 J domain-containing protein [Deltaproteobacteria bacterium]